MNVMNGLKKTAAVVLSAALAVSSIAYSGIVSEGADVIISNNGTQTDNYISMPITIRDFAADGMLFEMNLLSDLNTDGSLKSFSVYNNHASKIYTGKATGIFNASATTASGYVRYTSSGSDPAITYTIEENQDSDTYNNKNRALLRYAVVAYRTNAAATAQPTISHRSETAYYSYENFDTAGYNNMGKWTTAVMDLGSGSGPVNYVTIQPKLASGKYIDIAFVAFFANKEHADALAESCVGDDTQVETPIVAPTPTVNLLNHVLSHQYNDMTSYTGYTRFTSTINTGNAYITFSLPSTYTRNQVRYAVFKYRTNATAYKTPTIWHRSPTAYTEVNFSTAGYNSSSWKTVIVDLGGGTGNVTMVSMITGLYTNNYMDIADAVLFGSREDAELYVAADGQTGTDVAPPTISTASTTFTLQNNAGFGLLATSGATKFNDLTATTLAGSSIENNGSYLATTEPAPKGVMLNSGITQQLYGAYVRTNLVEGTLNADKKLEYTQVTVDYIASYLQKTLNETWMNSSGGYNIWYVMGTKLFTDSGEYVGPGEPDATKDLAQVLRDRITGGMGTYAAAKAKNPQSYTEVETYYDAAYFLLHNTFNSVDGYGLEIKDYNSLRLYEKVRDDGTRYYTFNSAYDGAVYDTTNKVIYNSQTTHITPRNKYGSTDVWYSRGNLQSMNSFNPIGDLGYGKNGDIYYEYVQHLNSEYGYDLQTYYSNTNYNMSLEGHAQFIYYEDDELYFTFTGDDDVYLFINGKRVLDLGGGHAISKASVNLNDVADELGLEDGKVYDFDFYYMERAGTAANFGIETNMKIVEPSMITNKLGFQNGVTTGYNGYVDPSKNVGYGFELTNSGNEPIKNLTFVDDTIGVSLTPTQITLNSRSSITEMYVVIYNDEGTVKDRYYAPDLTVDRLKTLLADGIEAGEKFGVYGVKYDITNEDWTAGGDTFTNTVKTTAESRDNVVLTGYAEWKVQKRGYTYNCFDVYDWIKDGVQHGVTVSKAELLQPILDAGQSVNASSVSIVLCSPSGQTDSTAISKNASVNADGSITYKGAKTGVENIYYKVVGGSWENVVFHYHAYTYSVTDDAFVLDYGLPVELFDARYGFLANDKAILAENTKTSVTVTGVSAATSNYGTFNYADTSFKYVPNRFMSGADSVSVTVRVMETDATELTKFTGVEMTQTITVVPANVVYYEDDFAGLTYLNNNGNQWVQSGNNTSVQSPDQNSNYGSDPVYSDDNNATDSNGTVGRLDVAKTDKVLIFGFTGTGFEIVSRTTCETYAVINVTVKNTAGEIVRQLPVITESKGGDLYQVPVISITGLTYGTYTVEVQAGGSNYGVNRVLFLDGIRIFNPLSDALAQQYYNSWEYNAKFLEVKQLIEDGQTIYANASEATSDLQFATGTTLIEDVNSDGVLKSISSLSDYLRFGPNNEIYLDGDAAVGMIAFYLSVDTNVDAADRTIQIGAHRKADSVNGSDGYVTMTYGSTAADIVNGTNSYKLYNGAEQYYTIDVTKLTAGEDGRYLVMIGVNGSEHQGEVLSLTSLKLNGYTISGVEAALVQADKNGTLSDSSVVSEISQVYDQKTGETVVDGE